MKHLAVFPDVRGITITYSLLICMKSKFYKFLFTLACLGSLGQIKAQQLIFSENFESSFPPPGWTIVNNGTGNNWTQNTTSTYAYKGTKSMMYGYSASDPADAWAFTPAITLNTNPVTITFYVRARSKTYPENLKVTIASDTVIANHTEVLLDSTGITNVAFNKWSTTYTPQFAGDFVLGFNCYSDPNQWNLYVDSISVYQLLPNCTGKPDGGYVKGPRSVCIAAGFLLSDSLVSTGKGIVYQWQQSIDSVTWTNVSGGNSNSLNAVINVPTWFRNKVVCTLSNDSAYSSVFKVGLKNPIDCYCTPANGTILHTFTDPSIDSVAIVGTTLDNNDVGANNADGYTFFPVNTNTTADLVQGKTYSLVTVFSGVNISSVWFDWNSDGVFDSTEWKQITTGSVGPVTISFTVPNTAVVGNTSMRIRSRASTSPNGKGDACTTFGSGETEDYLINIIKGSACSGKPLAGTIIGDTSVCPALPFTLSDTTASSGGGIDYQWQVSNNNGTSWVTINNSNSPSITTSISQLSLFRIKVKCANSGDSSFSSNYKVGLNDLSKCYCNPATGVTLHSATDPFIDSVAIVGTTLDNNDVGASNPNGYTQFDASGNTTADLELGKQYTLATVFSDLSIASVWFDWNKNGVYDSSEWSQITLNSSGTVNKNFTVPNNAVLGKIGMRIRSRVGGTVNGYGDACSQFGSGETEEYVVNIVQGVPCSGKPLAGTVLAPASVCPGVSFTLSDTGATSASGISYQWEISYNYGTTWSVVPSSNSTDITLALTKPANIRMRVLCSTSKDTSYSNTVSISLNPLALCYCSPNNGVTLHTATGPTIDSVIIVGTSLANKNKGATNTNGYTQFPNSGNTTANLVLGKTYTLATVMSGLSIVSAWFDWNKNGLYDSSEWVQVTASGTGRVSAQFTVPANALLGNTGFRVRARTDGTINGYGDPCTLFGSGETEEYIVNIVLDSFCKGKPNAGVITGPNTVQYGANFTLIDTGFSAFLGIVGQWQYSIDAAKTWDDLPGAIGPILNFSITNPLWFRYKVVCTFSNDSSFSNVWYVSFPLPIQLIGFRGEVTGKFNLLKWSTAVELNNKGFEILRSSNGKAFEKVAFLGSKAEKGKSNSLIGYTWTDEAPLPVSFYKLRQIDLDGKSCFSNVVSLLSKQSLDWTIAGIYPNPTRDVLTMNIITNYPQPIEIFVSDLAGRTVVSKSLELRPNECQLKIDVDMLAAGTYVLKVMGKLNKQTSVIKFQKE